MAMGCTPGPSWLGHIEINHMQWKHVLLCIVYFLGAVTATIIETENVLYHAVEKNDKGLNLSID